MRVATIIVFIVSILFMVWSFYEYQVQKESRFFNAETRGVQTVGLLKKQSDSVMMIVKKVSIRLTGEVEQSGLIEEDLLFLVAEAGKQPLLSSIRVAFEPYQFDSDVELFSLFYDCREQGFISVDSSHNYRDTTVFDAQWYTIPAIMLDDVLQTDFNSEASRLTADYSAPFFWTNNYGMGQLIGVVNISFSFDLISSHNMKYSLPDGVSANIIIVDETDNIIAHSRHTEIINQQVMDMLTLANFADQSDLFQEKAQGTLNYLSPDHDTSSTLHFDTSEQTGWKIVSIITQTNLMQSDEILERKKINLMLAAVLSLMLLIFLMVSFHQGRKRQV